MRLRAVTYNIHKGIGVLDRRCDLDRIRQVIAAADPDLVLLQEVAQNWLGDRHPRQVDMLGDALNLRHRSYFVNVHFKRKGQYGNAILSRFPITHTSNFCLRLPGKKARSVMHARLRVRLSSRKTRTLHVFNLHLGLAERERRVQLRRFLDTHPFARLHPRTPILLGGDFNDVWGSLGKLLRPAAFSGTSRPRATFPAFAPVRALDSVYVRGDLDMEHLKRSDLSLAKRASDHLPLIAELRIRGAQHPR